MDIVSPAPSKITKSTEPESIKLGSSLRSSNVLSSCLNTLLMFRRSFAQCDFTSPAQRPLELLASPKKVLGIVKGTSAGRARDFAARAAPSCGPGSPGGRDWVGAALRDRFAVRPRPAPGSRSPPPHAIARRIPLPDPYKCYFLFCGL
jgi:hypothetical protein